MNWRKAEEEEPDMTARLQQLEQMLKPRVVSPRAAADDQIPIHPPAPTMAPKARHMGRMYVAGHEPHFRPVTLLQQGKESRDE